MPPINFIKSNEPFKKDYFTLIERLFVCCNEGKDVIALQQSTMQCVLPYNKRLVGFSGFFFNFILQHQIDQKLDFMIFFYFFVNFFNLTLQQHNFLFIFLIFFNFIIQYQVVLGIVLYNVFRFPFCWVIYRSHRFFYFNLQYQIC